MEKKINPDEERRLTHSIEKAASLSLVDDKRDPSDLLAKCLLGDGIDRRFAKVASAAFNKRRSVLKFQHTPDDKRAETFAISDPDKVYSLMGGTDRKLEKSASADKVSWTPFKVGLAAARPMAKTASAKKQPEYVPFEYRVDADTYENHLVSIMDKLASEHQDGIAELRNLEGKISREKSSIDSRLRKVSSFELHTLVNVYGDKFVSNFCPESYDGSLKKTAGAVKPDTELARDIDRYFEDMEKQAALTDEMAEFQDNIEIFSKQAAKAGEMMHKVALTGLGAGVAVRAIEGFGEAVADEIGDTADTAVGAMRTGFRNAGSMLDAAGHDYISPAEVFDPKLITMEKYFDYSRAVSDLLADKIISKYPTKQVLKAARDLLSIEQLRDPKNRLLLKAQILEALTRNNMYGNAELAQLSTILEHLGKGENPLMASDLAAVSALQKQDEIPTPTLESIVPESFTHVSKSDPLQKAHDKNKEAVKEYLSAQETEEKKEKERREESNKPDKTKEQRQKAAAALGYKFMALPAAGSPAGWYIGGGRNGNSNPRLIPEAQVNADIDAYLKAMSRI